MASAVRLADGTFDASLGVNSGVVPMVKSAVNPNGLDRNALYWLDNGTVRGGTILPRNGFQSLAKVVKYTPGVTYQSGYLYAPKFAFPYLMLSISGTIYQVILGNDYTTSSVTNITAQFPGTQNPAQPLQGFMEQGEQFLIIQAGDLTSTKPTLPLFWDGATLRRSKGITNTAVAPGTPGVNEIPAAGAMKYYQGRLWYAQGLQFSAGDIVFGPSGTIQYQFADSILEVTENPLCVGGDGFSVPATSGNVNALFYVASINTPLGQSPLYIGTPNNIFQLTVPVNRADWIAAGASDPPVQVPVQLAWGPTSDRCVALVNGDAFYQSLEPGIRSLAVSVRNTGQWGNVALSRNIQLALQQQDRTLMQYSTGVEFDNRLLQAILPIETPVGPAFQAIATLDFDILSTFQAQVGQITGVSPAWEGMLEGMDVLQLFSGVFGGEPRCFAAVHSRLDDSIEVWEVTNYLTADQNPVNGTTDTRIQWYFQTPAYTWSREFDLKKLDGGEIWVDMVSGTVNMKVEYRCDGDPCWQEWSYTSFCAARNDQENAAISPEPQYPGSAYCQGWKFPITLPCPQQQPCQTDGSRPANVGYQIQFQITIQGYCRVRGMVFYALPVDRRPFEGLVCSTSTGGAT